MYKFDTVLYQFLETGTSERTLRGLDQLLRYSLYPLSFFLYRVNILTDLNRAKKKLINLLIPATVEIEAELNIYIIFAAIISTELKKYNC